MYAVQETRPAEGLRSATTGVNAQRNTRAHARTVCMYWNCEFTQVSLPPSCLRAWALSLTGYATSFLERKSSFSCRSCEKKGVDAPRGARAHACLRACVRAGANVRARATRARHPARTTQVRNHPPTHLVRASGRVVVLPTQVEEVVAAHAPGERVPHPADNERGQLPAAAAPGHPALRVAEVRRRRPHLRLVLRVRRQVV
jgi:hypothetical protein